MLNAYEHRLKKYKNVTFKYYYESFKKYTNEKSVPCIFCNNNAETLYCNWQCKEGYEAFCKKYNL